MQTHIPGAWGKCCLCFTISSAPSGVSWLGEDIFLLALSRQSAVRLSAVRKPHRSTALMLIESHVLIKGVMLRQVLF